MFTYGFSIEFFFSGAITLYPHETCWLELYGIQYQHWESFTYRICDKTEHTEFKEVSFHSRWVEVRGATTRYC